MYLKPRPVPEVTSESSQAPLVADGRVPRQDGGLSSRLRLSPGSVSERSAEREGALN